ncbi:oligopeptide ABC transporter substrate-binding protein [Paenisporosarcina quisquiliarum]|uniref:Oligopeptide ABC transporter substrate-binding protein n=1 Tax=Paenisporosarcina quisquiliarum TaxID=365346 RepID=A0A9X3LHL0_9BACL|nr:oligopeptide ABC transporter substrate-binding protein [Paenisporosarcina quisquiliarum]MCZ8536574.1 oligopeptide ABC transporter substrate-binding protein [Paenisporosarcina quisquiliarum]
MNKKLWTLLALLLAFMLVLGACNNEGDDSPKDNEGTEQGSEDGEEDGEDGGEAVDTSQFPLTVENEGDAMDGGTLKVALVNDSPFQGIFSLVLYEDAYDADIMQFASNAIFATDGDFLLTDEGIASLEVDQDNNKATVKIREGVKWSDGEPLKVEDLMQPYLIIGHKDYTGVRYDADFQNIVGAVEYHDGKADTISGLKKVDETTLEISFKKLSPAIFSGGDGLWSSAEPSHILKDIPVAGLLESDAVRKNIVTLGAFKFDKIVPGESVQFVKNENYWKGAPKLDAVLVKTVPSTSISVALQTGEYHMTANTFSTDKYLEIKDFDNLTILGRKELYYQYIGFKLGKYDMEKSEVVMDPNAKMGDVKLRQAMGYAIDVEQVSEVYYNNLRERATSLIPPVFASFYDDTLEGYSYDVDKANALLDEAGYKDVDGDGLRENKDGKPLEIKFATMSGGDIAEDIASFYLQNWKDVGLNVTLATGRTIEFNSFYDKVQADDPEIDIFMAAWGTGTNPSPSGLYSKTAQYNFSRYTSEKLEELLAAIDSPDAFDPEFRAGKFREWQEYMSENAPIIPTQYRLELRPVNKAVKNYDIDYSSNFDWNEVSLISEDPAKSSK